MTNQKRPSLRTVEIVRVDQMTDEQIDKLILDKQADPDNDDHLCLLLPFPAEAKIKVNPCSRHLTIRAEIEDAESMNEFLENLHALQGLYDDLSIEFENTYQGDIVVPLTMAVPQIESLNTSSENSSGER